MATFIVHVELHGASPADYVPLHAAMERRGFDRTILDSTGRTLRLPRSTYRYLTAAEVDSVVMEAVEAAKTVSESFAIVAVESKGLAFWDLKPDPK